MINYASPELFINMKRIPTRDSKEYKPFFKEEKRKIKEGVIINGVEFPGWLYWHINHWMINIDTIDPVTGIIERSDPCHPYLRDNEWIISEHIQKAEKLRKGLLILGSRQLGKSEFGSSYMGRRMLNFKNTQNVIAGLSDPDLGLLLSKLDKGFNNIHEYFRPIRIRDNWKEQVVLGYKDRQGNRNTYSELLIRNLDSGNNSENLAGPTTASLLLDEIGKGDFLESWIAARPAIETPFGFRGCPIFVGTSGSFDKSEDLQKFRENLDVHNFMEIEIKDHRDVTIHFIPGYQASKAKRKKIRLSNYLKKPKGSELDNIAIRVVENPEREIEVIKNTIADLEVTDPVLAKKEKMYYPITEEDLFLTNDDNNIFSEIKELAKEHLAYLESIEVDEEYGWLTRDSGTGKPKWVPTDQKPIIQFPTGEKEDKDSPIIVWSKPIEGQEFGILHVGGSDPYNQDQSLLSPSLGTLYIYRRTYDPTSGVFQDRFVACYAARPTSKRKWMEQVRLLLEWYGAKCLPENEDPDLIRWFDEKNIGHYLEDGLDLAKEINPNTKVQRPKGLSASPANIRYGNGLLKNYCWDDVIMGQDTNGDNIIKKGIVRISDKVLLKEIIAYKSGYEKRITTDSTTGKSKKKKRATNVDRIVGARHALILAALRDKYFPVAKVQKSQTEERPKRKPPRSPFIHTTGAFRKKKASPFRLS